LLTLKRKIEIQGSTRRVSLAYSASLRAFLFLTLLLPHELKPGQSPSIWRYVALTPPDTIWLGAPFTAERLADRINDSTYQLKPHTFGGAERIRLFTDARGRVTTIEFQYEAGANFAQMRSEYSSDLGPPKREARTAKGQSAFWQDKQTRFELVSWRVGEQEFVLARMRDASR